MIVRVSLAKQGQWERVEAGPRGKAVYLTQGALKDVRPWIDMSKSTPREHAHLLASSLL